MGAIHNGRLHAQGNVDTEGFADLLDRLLKAAWGQTWGTFTDKNPTGTTPEEVPLPIISWDVRERIPSEAMKQIKHRNWGTEPDPDNFGEFLTTFRQWFDCTIEFKVWAKTSREAKALLRKLEDVLLTYAGYFKEKGVSEITFLAETRGDVETAGRQDLACRVLAYRVRTEHITAVRTAALNEIITKVEAEG